VYKIHEEIRTIKTHHTAVTVQANNAFPEFEIVSVLEICYVCSEQYGMFKDYSLCTDCAGHYDVYLSYSKLR